MNIESLKNDQEFILNHIDNGVVLLNSSYQIVLWNQPFLDVVEISAELLGDHPNLEGFYELVVAQGNWSRKDCQILSQALETSEVLGEESGEKKPNEPIYIEQNNGICLQVKIIRTLKGDSLVTFRDVTVNQRSQSSLNEEVRRLRFLLGLNERLQNSDNVEEIGQFALKYLVKETKAAFGDVKVITGEGKKRQASALTNQVSTQFIATYGEPVILAMEDILRKGIPYNQGLLWQVVETGEPLFVEDYDRHPKALAQFRYPGVGQVGLFPIPGVNGKIIGILTLESRNLEKLQATPHQDMLLAACRTLGVAIERVQSQQHLRQINEELERSSQLKSEFLASMSHELRTPLNSILGFSDLLLRQTAGALTERQLNYIQLVEKSGQHLLQLINEILDLSKIEAGKVDLNLSPVSIHSLATECLTMIQPRADKKRIALSLELDYRVSNALLDERRIRQVMINLLSNAVKFTPEGGQVKLSGRLAYGGEMDGDYRPDCSPINHSTPYLCLEVKDSGIGIPEDRLHLLFRPFQQVDSSLTRRHEGTGLGLALTKRLAELHGGTVSLRSVCDQGSVFRVWLPLTEMRQELSAYQSSLLKDSSLSNAGSFSDGQKRVLVVEDQPFNQVLIMEMLQLEGYVVELIADGETMAKRMLDVSAELLLPDVVLMDIQLPDRDGLSLIRQLKENPLWKSIPVIALTAMAMTGDRERCLSAGADAYLSKPLVMADAISLIKSMIK